MALACVWLAALSSCDAMKSKGQSEREYQRALVAELCAPGGFYLECWWGDAMSCHEEMAVWVANSMPEQDDPRRVQPSEALRQKILERLFFFHTAYGGAIMSPSGLMERERGMPGRDALETYSTRGERYAGQAS